MGTSNWQNISYNIELVRRINPKSILDIGVGFGRWGVLFREFLEIWESGIYDGKWDRNIDGVEIYPGYIQDYHRFFYDNIYIDDAADFLRKLNRKYDLINFGDVIEHMAKQTGEEMIDLALQKSRFVIITVPIGGNWSQGGTADNPYEEHKSIWYNRDFLKYRHNKIKCFEDYTKRNFSVILLSLKKIRFEKRFGRFFNLKNFLKHKLGLKRLIKSYEKSKTK